MFVAINVLNIKILQHLIYYYAIVLKFLRDVINQKIKKEIYSTYIIDCKINQIQIFKYDIFLKNNCLL